MDICWMRYYFVKWNGGDDEQRRGIYLLGPFPFSIMAVEVNVEVEVEVEGKRREEKTRGRQGGWFYIGLGRQGHHPVPGMCNFNRELRSFSPSSSSTPPLPPCRSIQQPNINGIRKKNILAKGNETGWIGLTSDLTSHHTSIYYLSSLHSSEELWRFFTQENVHFFL